MFNFGMTKKCNGLIIGIVENGNGRQLQWIVKLEMKERVCK